MTETLEQVIADARGELPILEKRNGSWSPRDVLEFIDRVTAAAEEWLTWLSEGDASIRSGYSEAWVRSRYAQLEHEGHARKTGRARQYRACMIPRRANVVTAANRGREAARKLKKTA